MVGLSQLHVFISLYMHFYPCICYEEITFSSVRATFLEIKKEMKDMI